MDIGVTIRNMGPQSTRELIVGCARAAEDMAFESIWITDHTAMPPGDAEWSGSRCLDTLSVAGRPMPSNGWQSMAMADCLWRGPLKTLPLGWKCIAS